MIFTLPFSRSMVETFFVLALASWIVKRWIWRRPQTPPSFSSGNSKESKGRSPTRAHRQDYAPYPSRVDWRAGTDHRPQTARFIEKIKERIFILIETFKPIETKLNLPIGMFVLVGFLSTLTSVSLSLSLEGFFFKMVEWIMIYFIVVETMNSRKKVNRILAIIFLSIALITANGIFQLLTGTDFIRNYSMIGQRMQSSFNSSNGFAGWLVVMIPLALSLAYFGKSSWFDASERYIRLKMLVKPMAWVLTCVSVLCLVLAYSRGAWIASLLSLVFFGILRSKKLLIIIMIALLISPFFVNDDIKIRVNSIIRISKVNTDRFSLWSEALSIIKDFPLLGSGLNTYATVAPSYRITEETGVYPHNSYLHMAAESGLLGLGAFVWIIITLFKTSLASLKRINDRFHDVVLIGLLTGLFGFLIHSFVDVNIYTLHLGNLMWFVMGLIVAVQKTAVT
jgi:putative inorganic carbon (HCO3(-)) transporter